MKIRLKFQADFLLLCAWLLYSDQSGIVWKGFLACLIHEIAHCAALRHFRVPVKEIRFTLSGAQLYFETSLSYVQEMICAAAGPAVNLLLAYTFASVPSCTSFAGINLALAVFNLLPIGQLDGARILRCALSIVFCEKTSFVISSTLSVCFTLIFCCTGLYAALFWRNLTLLFMVLWLFNRMIFEKHCSNNKKNRNRACQKIQKKVKYLVRL